MWIDRAGAGTMDEDIAIDLNGKLTLPLRLVRSVVIAARTGWSDRLEAGQFLKIVDPNGKQAGDFWAFNAANPAEHLSAMHTRVWVNRLCPRPGESFHTNHRRPHPAACAGHLRRARPADRAVR